MINRLFSWLEGTVDSFPAVPPAMPKASTWGFIRFYSRPFLPIILVGLALSVAIAIIEVRVYAYVGKLIDLLGKADPATFFADHGTEMLVYAALALLIQPGLAMLGDAVENQGLRGNFAMRTRWLAHRYMLRQSMEFFHNEFAGRVATKVMQAALGVRDVVMKITQVISYVVVYVGAALFSFASYDPRLAIPMVVWVCRVFFRGPPFRAAHG